MVLNQVLFRFGDDAATDLALRSVVGGRRAIRLSVCNWRTTDEDIERVVAAFRHAAAGHGLPIRP